MSAVPVHSQTLLPMTKAFHEAVCEMVGRFAGPKDAASAWGVSDRAVRHVVQWDQTHVSLSVADRILCHEPSPWRLVDFWPELGT